MRVVLCLTLFVTVSVATNDVCNNYLQILQQCVANIELNTDKCGSHGTAGERGPPGTVNYDIIDEKLNIKFKESESRINQTLASFDEAIKNLGSVGERGPPGTVDYDIIDEKLNIKFQELRAVSITDCRKVSTEDAKNTSQGGGVFDIYINSIKTEVYCDLTTDGGGWIVFQRRMNGSEDFYRGWNDYVNGFGDKQAEFWMGLEDLHNIISSGKYELRIDLEDWSGNKRYAKYSNFKIGDAASKYQLTIGGYSGDATDSISEGNGNIFSTKDKDHDTWSGNCAVSYKGAWWYGACHKANLNGFYFKGGAHSSFADGIEWNSWTGYHYSLKFVEMKIRPVF